MANTPYSNRLSKEHELLCDDVQLARGVKRERKWVCTAGDWEAYAYDSAAKREFRTHLNEVVGMPWTHR